jgi:cob(I)alamin adenosyltransferase
MCLGAQDVQDCVCGIVQGRANLAATLKDARTVVGKLERFMAVVVQALFLFLYLMIWQVHILR